MANGILGSADLGSAIYTSIYEVPEDTYTVCSINLCNRTSAAINIRIVIGTSEIPQDSEYIEFNSVIVANGVLERTGIVLKSGEKVTVYAGNTGVSANVYGIETTTL